MKMKSFKQFMNEADIKGNPAVSPEYLTSLNKRAEASARDIEQRLGREMGNLMRFVMEVQSMQRGKEKQIEDLTRSVIEEQYGSILGKTELDIRIPTDPREMKQLMAQEQPEEQETPSFKEIEDEDTKTAIHKRKIQNVIAQGEAINSKKMLMGDTNMAGLTELFGEEKARRMVELLVKITDICNARDWRIPEEVGAAMIEQGNGLSGISKIEWKPKEEKEADETPKEDDMNPEEDHQSDKAKLIILGMDQAMLLHEAVKAIYGLINQGGLAHLDDETIAKVFMNADTARDEVQDLKRAKLTAADLRDFINTFPEVADIENGREYVWGKMIDASIIPDIKFLELMRLIFTAAPLYRQVSENEPPYTEDEISAAREAMPKAKAIVQKLIQLIQDELAEWEDSVSGSGYDDEEYGDSSFDTAFYNDFEPNVARGELSQSEIRDLIDQALDSGDSEEFKRLSKLLKENLNEALTADQIAAQIQAASAGAGTDEETLTSAIRSIPDAASLVKINQALKAGHADPQKSWAYPSVGDAINGELGILDASYKTQIMTHIKNIRAEQYLNSFKAPPPPTDPVIASIKDRVIKHEGSKPFKYLDSKKIPTIGVGFNLNREDATAQLKKVGANPEKVKAGKSPLTQEQITALLFTDLKQAKVNAQELVPNMPNLPTQVQGVLTEMVFNLGKRGLSEFTNFLTHIKQKNFDAASEEMLRSAWAKQVGDRAKTLAAVIKSA